MAVAALGCHSDPSQGSHARSKHPLVGYAYGRWFPSTSLFRNEKSSQKSSYPFLLKWVSKHDISDATLVDNFIQNIECSLKSNV